MEGLSNKELLDGAVEIVSVGYEKRTSMVKGIIVGASVVGAGWLCTHLYKKFKNRETKEAVVKYVE